jgi:hypothetical protein
MSFEVLSYTAADEAAWDAFCEGSVNGTLLHTRRFLGYHGDRFADASVMLRHEGALVGLLPAATLPADAQVVVSHPGATFGGIVHQGWLGGQRMIDALAAVRSHYTARGCRRLHYKAVPPTYTRVPAQDDLYALWRLGAQRVRCDLSSSVDLAAPRTPSERRRRALKKALKVVTLSSDLAHLPALWAVLEDNLARKHEARPVHTLAEISLLFDRFPQWLQLRCALVQGRVEAGVVFFNAPTLWHAQYIASSSMGYECNALDAVMHGAMGDARAQNARYFDFGTSNEDGGRVLNDGLYRFKSEFGGGGIAHEFYDLALD